jgi:hypothetical protein
MRKTAKEILDSSVSNDDRHAWLASATVDELYEFQRWVKQDSSWALHGRDALNVLLAKENIKLQKDIRGMTKQLHRLTIVLVFLALIQVYPSLKLLYTDIKSFLNPPKTEGTTNQLNDAKQIQNNNNQMLNKIEDIKHK